MLYGKEPYKKMDRISDVQSLKNIQLTFPEENPISDETKEFLRKSLCLNENQRPSI